MPQPCRHQQTLVLPADTFAHGRHIQISLLRPISQTQAAAQIDKLHLYTQSLLNFHRQLKHHGGRADKIISRQLVRNDHGVQTEALNPLITANADTLHQLLMRHAVLGLLRLTNDGITALTRRTGIITEGNYLGQTAGFLQKRNMRKVIQIDGGTQIASLLELLGRCVVGGKANLRTAHTNSLGQQQLGVRAAIRTLPLRLHNFQNIGVGQGLHGIMLAETGCPGKSLGQLSHLAAYPLLII